MTTDPHMFAYHQAVEELLARVGKVKSMLDDGMKNGNLRMRVSEARLELDDITALEGLQVQYLLLTKSKQDGS